MEPGISVLVSHRCAVERAMGSVLCGETWKMRRKAGLGSNASTAVDGFLYGKKLNYGN